MNRRDQARTLLRQIEGSCSQPYQDVRGVWTIGCGCTTDLEGRDVTRDTPPLTAEQIDELLDRAITWAGIIVDKHVERELSDNQWAALTSFVFNEGPGEAGEKDGFVVLRDGAPSHMLVALNAGDYAGASAQFPLWDKAAGIVVRGLVKRRLLERALFDGRFKVG